jgi:hypothetical protein
LVGVLAALSFIGGGSDLIISLIWGEVLWSTLVVVGGVVAVSSGSVAVTFSCVVFLVLSALELVLLISVVGQR